MAYFGIGFMVILALVGHSEANSRAMPAYCQPWRVPVAVDSPVHRVIPFFVELHRCQGQCTNTNVKTPLQCECVAHTTKNVKLVVSTTNGNKLLTLKNHTSCKSQCKASHKNKCLADKHQWDKQSCTCSCPTSSSGACPGNQVWDTNSCECKCPNKPNNCGPFDKSWNKSSCSCECTVDAFAKCSKRNLATNMKTCFCFRPVAAGRAVGDEAGNKKETKLVVSLVAIGLLLGTLFIIDLVLMCNKKGFMYGLGMKCSERRANPEFIDEIQAETGSITMDAEARQPVVNGHCVHKHQHYVTQESITSV